MFIKDDPEKVDRIINLWKTLPESADWPPVGWVHQCVDRPNFYAIGAAQIHGAETFAVFSLRGKRVVSEEEFPSQLFEDLVWVGLCGDRPRAQEIES